MSLVIDPALRRRIAIAMFRRSVGEKDWALLVGRHGQEKAEAFATPYESWVEVAAACILAEGGALPGAALVADDPLG